EGYDGAASDGAREARPVDRQRCGGRSGRDLAHDREEVDLDRIFVVTADIRAIEAREIGPERTPGDLVRGDAIADEAGRRRRGRRVPLQERSDIGRRQSGPESTGGRARGRRRGR